MVDVFVLAQNLLLLVSSHGTLDLLRVTNADKGPIIVGQKGHRLHLPQLPYPLAYCDAAIHYDFNRSHVAHGRVRILINGLN